MIRHLHFAIALILAGCGYWGRRPIEQPMSLQSNDPVWIWTGTVVKKWHAVVITQDSVSGIPFEDSDSCYLCRLSIPRTSVDSMKLGYKTGFQKTSWKVARDVGYVAAFFAVWAGVCYLAGSPQDC